MIFRDRQTPHHNIYINIKVFHYQDCLTLSKQTWSPVIVIDNTNVQKFEIFPYIQLANRYRYSSCHTSLHKVHPVLVLETPTPCVCVCMCICMCICICSGIQCLCLRPQPRGQRTRRSWLGETRMESPRRSLPRGSGNGNHFHHCKVQQRN